MAASTDISKAEGECGIITTMIDRFNAENPDIHVDVNVVAWPGYPQLTAQVAARDPPDLVTMHEGVISDYALKGLVEPVDLYLRRRTSARTISPARAAPDVTIGRHIYGLPWDTHGGLFHVNTALFAKAGLMRGGKPVLPNTPDELIAQARQFEQRTGKPYLIQSNVGDPAFAARNLYTYMMAQGRRAVPGRASHQAQHAGRTSRLRPSSAVSTPSAWAPRTWTRLEQLPPSSAAKGNLSDGHVDDRLLRAGGGDAGTATLQELRRLPLSAPVGRACRVRQRSRWVVPMRKRTPRQRAAIARFFKFMASHNYDWARTGHIPAFKSVLVDPRFKSLPHREDIAPLASLGRPLPSYVQRQNAIEGIVGEEAAAAFTGQKPIPARLPMPSDA